MAVLLLACLQGFAQASRPVFNASRFGVRSDGTFDNTTAIQGAVDFISANGGGELVFWVGRYLTGAIELKDNVTIRLREGAVIVGSTNIYSYKGHQAIFWGEGLQNVTIYDLGVIDGRGPELRKSMQERMDKGLLPADTVVPTLVYLKDCRGCLLKNLVMRRPATSPELYIIEGGGVQVEGCYSDTE